jgi:hypothetical protein
MNPPRPSLNIEIFEDRLLPSTFAIGGIDPLSTIPTHSFQVSIWHQQDATPSDFGRHGIAVTNPSANPNSSSDFQGVDDGPKGPVAWTSSNPNSVSDFQDQATNSGDVSSPVTSSTNLNSVSGSDGNTPQSVWGGSPVTAPSTTTPGSVSLPEQPSSNNLATGGVSEPQPLTGGVSSPQPLSGGSVVVLIRSYDFHSVLDSQDGRAPPWFNHDNQFSGMNSPDGMNGAGLPWDRAGYANSSQDDSVAPSEVAAPSSTPPSEPASVQPPSVPVSAQPLPEPAPASVTPLILLVSTAPQQNVGQASISEQLAQTEPHILAEITLAAVSLMGSQVVLSIPMSPTVVGSYPTSATELSLPSAAVDRSILRVKAPTPIPSTETASTSPTLLSPIEIHAPNGVPVVGAIGLNAAELDERVSRVLASISNLGLELAEELEQPGAYTWLVAAGLLSVGAGYAAWSNQKSRRVAHFPIGRGSIGVWEGEEHDARNR